MAVLLLVALFAPTPLSRTTQAEQATNACQALTNAYALCTLNNPAEQCTAIAEQMAVHCGGSSSGSTSGSY